MSGILTFVDRKKNSAPDTTGEQARFVTAIAKGLSDKISASTSGMGGSFAAGANPITDFGFWKSEIAFPEELDANSGSAPDVQIR
jgi:hypothetical protein